MTQIRKIFLGGLTGIYIFLKFPKFKIELRLELKVVCVTKFLFLLDGVTNATEIVYDCFRVGLFRID
jgi:hypothetical protein